MPLYRCLKSVGFQITLINATVERNQVRCGLMYVGANASDLPQRLTDVDTDQPIGWFIAPEELQNQPTHSWIHSPLDDLEFNFSPYET